MSKKILVTGGAGYIGSHAVKELLKGGYEVVVYDRMDHPKTNILDGVTYIEKDLLDGAALRKAFETKFDGVMHFAALVQVEESQREPGKYFRNNVVGTLNLLDEVVRTEVPVFIFSSSAAVYGIPSNIPVSEEADMRPINTYGLTKKMMEEALNAYGSAHNFNFALLRYFNAAGADESGTIGYHVATHLLPLVLDAAMGVSEGITIFGTDFETSDGTCIRDYIHVSDLAEAHVRVLEQISKDKKDLILNLGTGRGYSVREVIAAVKDITGKDFTVMESGRRAGDPPALVANPERAKKALGWEAKRKLPDIVRDAWKYHAKKKG